MNVLSRRIVVTSLTSAIVFTVGSSVRAQDDFQPILAAAVAKGIVSPKTGANKAATRFKPSGKRLLLDSFVNSLSDAADERKIYRETLTALLTEYEKTAKEAGIENEITLAVTYAVSQYWTIGKAATVSETASDAIYTQLRGALEVPEIAKLSDTEKQRLYEKVLLTAFTLQITETLTAAKGNDEAKSKIAAAARIALQDLVGIEADKLLLTEKGLAVVGGASAIVAKNTPAASSTTTPTTAATSGKTPDHTPPKGYEKKVYADGTIIYSAQLQDDDRLHSCEIRLLPPRPAPKGAAAAFQQLWKESFFEFDAGEVSMAYRRVFYPSKAVCHYMGGFFRPKNDPQTLRYLVLYVFALGDTVQPVIASVLPGRGKFDYDPKPSAGATLHKGLGPFVDSIQLKNVPLVPASLFSREEIIGVWGENTSAAALGSQYVTSSGNYAGEAVVSSGLNMQFHPDGTYNYKFVGALRGGRDIVSDKSTGKFTFKNDIIYFTPNETKSYKYDRKVVGSGFVQTEKGLKRLLLTVGLNEGEPPFLPTGRQALQGDKEWLTEK
jgi:hypothetical protein